MPIVTCDWVVYGRKVGKTVRMNLAGMNSITRIEVPNITREAQNLRRVYKSQVACVFSSHLRMCLGMLR